MRIQVECSKDFIIRKSAKLRECFSDEGPLQDITKVAVTVGANNSAQSYIFRPEENPGTLVIDVSMKDMADFLIPGLVSFLKKHFSVSADTQRTFKR